MPGRPEPRMNDAATVAPTVSDDMLLGYVPGSLWCGPTLDDIYACRDGAEGAAVWESLNNPVGNTVNNSTLITTTSSNFILATGMSVTPPAGTYLVFWAATVSTDDTTKGQCWLQIYKDSTAQGSETVAERGDSSTDNKIGCTCYAKVTVNGAEALEGRWKTEAGSITGEMYSRQLAWIKVAA